MTNFICGDCNTVFSERDFVTNFVEGERSNGVCTPDEYTNCCPYCGSDCCEKIYFCQSCDKQVEKNIEYCEECMGSE